MPTDASVIAMHNIARRYQQLFPNILTEVYSPSRFHFRHNNAIRTNTSIRAFANGLFGESGSQNVIYEDVPDNDWFLRPFDLCREYSDEWVWENERRQAFQRGPEMQELVQEVNRKLGFHGSNQLSYDTIFYLKRWCSFETSSGFEQSNSPIGPDAAWCAPFSVAHNALIEYMEDLARFYASGYEYGCEIFETLFNCDTHLQLTDTAFRINVYSKIYIVV